MDNNFKMIDVGNKQITKRLAIAKGKILVGKEAFDLIKNKKLPKGDALILAEIAGINGAKLAYQMLTLCHPLGLDMVKIITQLNDDEHSIECFCIASTHAKTGIEMEVLAGVNNALLTIWDLSKMINPNLKIADVELILKTGGKSGVWKNPNYCPDWINDYIPKKPQSLKDRNVAIITMSDRASAGIYDDKSGENIKNIMLENGAIICAKEIIPDDPDDIKQSIETIINTHAPHLIICTGGTGVAQRDFTPETLMPMFDKIIPGIGEILRTDGAKFTPLSWSSRAIGGIINQTLVITLPGNPKAVIEGLSALLPDLLPHLIRIIKGEK